MQELQATLEHTPIPHDDVIAKGHRTVWYTWFETFHRKSTLSCLFEVRAFGHASLRNLNCLAMCLIVDMLVYVPRNAHWTMA